MINRADRVAARRSPTHIPSAFPAINIAERRKHFPRRVKSALRYFAD
jgi:hypothetical protein